MRNCFQLAICLLLAPGVSFAQSLPLNSEVAAYYSTTPHEDEMLVRTRDGCGWFIPKPHAAAIRSLPDLMLRISENFKRYNWEGVCHNGLALGPGKTFFYDEKGVLTSTQQTWALNGRKFGLSLTTIMPSEKYDTGLVQEISWMGTSYSRNVRDVMPLEPKDGRNYSPSVAYDPPDPIKAVRYTLAPLFLDTPARIVQLSLTEKFLQTGHYFDRLTDYPCPRGCGALWLEKAGPIIRGFDEFERQHAAEIEMVKASLDPVLKPLLAEQSRDLQANRKSGPPSANVTTHSSTQGEF